jgi:hypothetical protein
MLTQKELIEKENHLLTKERELMAAADNMAAAAASFSNGYDHFIASRDVMKHDIEELFVEIKEVAAQNGLAGF